MSGTKPRPEDAQYRGLYLSRGTIWARRRERRRDLYRFDTQETSWKRAVRVRDAYERELGLDGRVPRLRGAHVPTLGEWAPVYLERHLGYLSPSTARDRRSQLGEGAPWLARLGSRRIDEIEIDDLAAFWREEVEDAGRSISWGKNMLSALSMALRAARMEGHEVPDVAGAYRRDGLSLRLKTKRGRRAAESLADPLSGEQLRALLAAARQEQPHQARTASPGMANATPAYLVVLTLLDTGMRFGEVEALTWGQIGFGQDEDDRSRHILVDRAGRVEDAPKSGRSRKVGLSRRLRRELLAHRLAQGRPDAEARVFPKLISNNWRPRVWRRVVEKAKLPARTMPKQLRDSFASHLLSLGVPLDRVSRLLGHSSPQVTLKHYARWIQDDAEGDVIQRHPGEVWADLLSRLEAEKWTQSGHSREGNPLSP